MKGWWIEIVWQVLIPALFTGFLITFYPFRDEIGGADEGINVIKGLLVNEGFELYKEIWNDQPPLYSYILSTLYHFSGYSFTLSRLSTVALSAILMWACIQYLRIGWGNLAGMIGALLLFLLPEYNHLSTAAMVGLPAISFAMVSMLFLVLWHRRQEKRWLVLSGVFLGLSTLTKLFTGFLAPIFLIGLLAGEFPHMKTDRNWRRFLQPAVIWGLSLSAMMIFAVLVFVKIENLAQLIAPHLSAREIDVFEITEFPISFYVKAVMEMILLALIGMIIAIVHKSWLTLYPAAWMVTAYILLSYHSPVWSHQQLLVTIPIAILASVAVGDSARFLVRNLKKREADWLAILLRAIPVIVFIQVITVYFPRAIAEFELHPQVGIRLTSAEMTVLSKMNDYADQTNWIVTDLPIYAFRIQKPVPPTLAVFSRKRILTGNLMETDVIEAILEYQPEQVMLGRFELPSVREYLDGNYRQVHERSPFVLYVRPDLIDAGAHR